MKNANAAAESAPRAIDTQAALAPQAALAQIGAWTLARIGAREFVAGGDALHFRIGARGRKIRIVLAADDTYTVELWKIRGFDATLAKSVETVYADSLSSVVERMAS